ncbi:helix-turn-helix domain-containing protein [Shimia thalassica]|uniref:helix-turn-helix domain-containing protein n=1 Tax=Shimia thalassica TaxID=1715693 RepID=UPI00349FA66C
MTDIHSDWGERARRNGWLIRKSSENLLHLRCSKCGCDGEAVLRADYSALVPEPCQGPHNRGYGAPVFVPFRALVEELRRRRRTLGLSQVDLEAAGGFADGHISKLESFAKIPTQETLDLWMKTLGLEFFVQAIPLPAKTLAVIHAEGTKIDKIY